MIIMPKNAQTHIQKMEPGPPTAMEVATPEILPMPTAPPSARQNALYGEILPSPLLPDSVLLARTVFFTAWPKCTKGKNLPLTM